MRSLRDLRNKRAFAKTRSEAEASGGRVCGTVLPSGKPVYFVMATDATDDQIAAKAFEVREGRALTQGEVMLRSAAEAHRKRQEALA